MWFMNRLREKLKHFAAPTCPDCWGVGRRWIQDQFHNLHFAPCRLCRGTGRILEDDTQGE
jgi:DnaJ-class molecular chaperone